MDRPAPRRPEPSAPAPGTPAPGTPAPRRPDWGATSADYARHRGGFPDRFYDRLFAEGLVQRGDRVLDLGTGTGTVARALAARGVAEALGLDPAPGQVAEAERLARAEGVASVARFRVGSAEATGEPDAARDVVVAAQAWHWFDRARAAAEARRVLRPGGLLLIAHHDWLPLPGTVAHASEYLIEAHNPAWAMGGGDGFHGAWAGDLWRGGFRDLAFFGFDHDAAYSHEAWRGRIRASAGVGAALPPEAVAAFDAAHARLLAERFPADPLRVPHRVFAIHARAPG